MKMNVFRFALGLGITFGLLSACSVPTPAPPPPAPAATIEQPTPVSIQPSAVPPTDTSVPPTDTPTNTLVPPTATSTATNTNSPVPPTATATATATGVPPTRTPTKILPTATQKPTAPPVISKFYTVTWKTGIQYDARNNTSFWCKLHNEYINQSSEDMPFQNKDTLIKFFFGGSAIATVDGYEPVFGIANPDGSINRWAAGTPKPLVGPMELNSSRRTRLKPARTRVTGRSIPSRIQANIAATLTSNGRDKSAQRNFQAKVISSTRMRLCRRARRS